MFANDHNLGGGGANRSTIATGPNTKPSSLKPNLRGVSPQGAGIVGQTAQTNQ